MSASARFHRRLVLLLALLCLLAAPAFPTTGIDPSVSPAAASIHLSQTEKAFLKAHPLIRLGVGEDWAPSVIRRPSGDLDGFEVDLLRHVNTVTGANIELVAGPWQEIVERATVRELDGLSTSAATRKRAESFLFSDSYMSVYPLFVVAADSPRKIEKIEDLHGQTVAFLAGHAVYSAMLAAHPQITVLEAPSEADAIRAVIEGRAAAAIVATTQFARHSKTFNPLVRAGFVLTDQPIRVLYSVRNDWPELVTILNKALAALPVEEFNRIYRRWFELDPPEVKAGPGNLRLTSEERAWLEQKHVVRARVGQYPPFHSYGDYGVRGMAVDYLDLVAEKADFKVEYVAGGSWSNALEDIRAHRNIDLLLSAIKTPERMEYLVFTKNYLASPAVIFTRENSPFISSIDDLAHKTVVVERDFFAHKRLVADFPEIKLLVVVSTEEALKALAAGQADGYVGNLTTGTYISRTKGLTNIKVAAPSSFGSDGEAMAVRNDWPELAGIIDKTLAAITPEEHEAIRSRWLPPLRYEYGISGRDVFRWIAGVSVFLLSVIAVILVWNKKLGREITARTAAEEQLSMSEEKYRTLFERSADAILIIEGDRFVDCNDATVRMLGYDSRAGVLNTHPWDLSPQMQTDGRLSQEKAAEMIAIALHRGSHRFEWDHLRANGEVFPVEVLLTAVPKGDREILHVVWRDITVRKKAESVQAELTADLERKNQELERFTYAVSHDLKSPLITIQGFSGLLEQSLGERIDDDIRQSLRYINSAAKNMYVLLDELLELSRIGRVVNPSESLDMAEVTQEALELIEGLMVDRSVTVSVAGNLPRIVGDRTRLREVMQNLLENAIKYFGQQAEPRIEIGFSLSDGAPACYVRDNGIGIPPKYHEKVFGLFERLSHDDEGSGVGLTQVKRIIELHGGRIWIESTGVAGEGTTFWFTLPWEESAV